MSSSASKSDDSLIDTNLSKKSQSTCSSVEDEYKELLKFAVVTPKWPSFEEISLNNPLHVDIATKQTSTSKIERKLRGSKAKSSESKNEEESFHGLNHNDLQNEPMTEEACGITQKKSFIRGEEIFQTKNKKRSTSNEEDSVKEDCFEEDLAEEDLVEEDLVEEDSVKEDLVEEDNDARIFLSHKHQQSTHNLLCLSNSTIITSVNQHYVNLRDEFKDFLSHSSIGRDNLILEKMEAIKIGLINRFLELLEEKNEICRRKEEAIQADLQNKKDLNKILENSLSRKDKIIQNLVNSIKKLKSKLELTKSLNNWQNEVVDKKRLDFCDKLAQAHYEKKLASKAIQCWKKNYATTMTDTIEKFCKDKAENTTRKYLEEYENRLENKKKENDELRREILRLKTEKDEMTQAMQEAFMRGVCALNYEARNLFNVTTDCQQDSQTEYYQQKACLQKQALKTSTKSSNFRSNQPMTSSNQPMTSSNLVHKPTTCSCNQPQSKRSNNLSCLKCPNEKLRPCQDNFTDLRPLNATGRYVEPARLLPVAQTTKLKCGKPVLVERHVGSQNGNTVVHIRGYPNSAISPIPVVEAQKQPFQKDSCFIIGRSIRK